MGRASTPGLMAGAIALLFSSQAHAQPAAADRALATDLFDQGRALLGAGQYSEACPKFAESQRLDPSAGTLLNLANCHELEGKTATAWSDFNEALAVAEREGQPERIAFARTHIAELAPKLSRLVIVLPPEVGSNFELTRDGTIITRVIIGNAMPIDPGSHRVELRAPGFEPWTATVEIGAGEHRELVVGQLVPMQTAATDRAPPPPTREPLPELRSSRRTVAWIVGGGGVVAASIGTVAGILAVTKSARSEELCAPRCSDEGYALNQEAKTAADVSTAALVVGAIAVGVSAFLFITSPSSTKPARYPFRF